MGSWDYKFFNPGFWDWEINPIIAIITCSQAGLDGFDQIFSWKQKTLYENQCRRGREAGVELPLLNFGLS